MTAVEVCPICDVAGCHHIRDRAEKRRKQLEALRAVRDKLKWDGEAGHMDLETVQFAAFMAVFHLIELLEEQE